MMMMMRRVMCVLAVVLCCACGYTMTAAAAVDNDSPSGRGVSRGAVEVSCGAGGALRVRPAAESEWLTCGAGSRVSACGKYADLCRQRTARGATTTTIPTTEGQPKAVMASESDLSQWKDDKPIFTSPAKWKNKSSALYTTWDWVPSNGYPVMPSSNGGERNQISGSPLTTVKTSNDGEGHDVSQSEPQLSAPEIQPQQEEVVLPVLEENSKADSLASPKSQHQGDKAAESGLSSGVSGSPNKENSSVETQSPLITTTRTHSPEGDHSTRSSPKGESDNATGNINNNDVLISQHPSAETESTTPGDHNTSQNSSHAALDTNIKEGSQETNSTIPASTTNTVSEATTTTSIPSVPNSEIKTIASTVQNKPIVDSSVSPVWIRTAAPLLIVAVLVSVTVY